MPTYTVTDPTSGQTVKLTGDSAPTEAELNDIFSKIGPAKSPSMMDYASDVARSGATGLAQGVAGLAGMGGDIRNLTTGGLHALGLNSAANAADTLMKPLPQFLGGGPSSADINAQIQKPFGGYHVPTTEAGHIAQTLGSYAPAVVGGPEGLASRILTRAVLPTAGAEIGRNIAPKGYEGAGEVVGSLAGGLAPDALGQAARLAGHGAALTLGGLTGVGPRAVREGFNAGVAGGPQSDAFTTALRGSTTWDQVVTDAKGALANMRADRNAAYRSGMVDIKSDPTVLSFAPLDQKMSDLGGVKNFKGIDTSPSTAAVRQQITQAVDMWRGLDPAQYHTPEGFDALKQLIGDIKDAQPFNTPQRTVAEGAYSAVRNTIADQAPTYNRVMGDYSKASDTLEQLQREMSLKPDTNPATALRKLQSVMRDNVNTSWGQRANMVDTLAQHGAPNIVPSLAGQALSAALPRGLARIGDTGIGVSALLTHPAALAALPLASPRVVGELAHGTGRAVALARALKGAAPVTAESRARRFVPGTMALGRALLGAQ